MVDDDIIRNILMVDLSSATSNITNKLDGGKQTVSYHIQKLGFVKKYIKWASHELINKNRL